MHKLFMQYLLDIDRFNCRRIIFENKDKVDVIEEMIVPSLVEIGKGWEEGEYSLSQIYMSSVICEDISEEIFASNRRDNQNKSNIAIVTFDDYHTFGKKLVILALKSSGFKILDFGMIFEEEKLLKLVKENKIDILLMSVLMLPPALKIIELKPKLLAINPNIKIVVGGAPFRFDETLYKRVGADGTGSTPNDAIKIILEMEKAL